VKKFLRWLGFAVIGLIALLVLALMYVNFAFDRAMSRQYKVAETLSVPLPTDANEIAEGKRLAHLTGCISCHGQDLEGAFIVEIPGAARFIGPNISNVLPAYSDAQLVGLLRRGVKLDGTGAWLMPSEMFQHLHDDDLARIVAWLRTVPARDGIAERTQIHVMGRAIVALGGFKSAAQQIEEQTGPRIDTSSRGAYLVMNLCSECHGQDLKGREEAKAPSLIVAKGYSADDFSRLMYTGIGLGGRTFELMTPISKARFAHLTPDEIEAMRGYLAGAKL
jgi:cytochrome c553